jgi:hypothetical protein
MMSKSTAVPANSYEDDSVGSKRVNAATKLTEHSSKVELAFRSNWIYNSHLSLLKRKPMQHNEPNLIETFLLLCEKINKDIALAKNGEASLVTEEDVAFFQKNHKKLALLLHPDKIGDNKDLASLWNTATTLKEALINLNTYQQLREQAGIQSTFINCYNVSDDFKNKFLNKNVPTLPLSDPKISLFHRKPKPAAVIPQDFSGLFQCGISTQYRPASGLGRAFFTEAKNNVCLELNTIIQDKNILNLPNALENFIQQIFIESGSQVGAFSLALLDKCLTDWLINFTSGRFIDYLFLQLPSYLHTMKIAQGLRTFGSPKLIAKEIMKQLGMSSLATSYAFIGGAFGNPLLTSMFAGATTSLATNYALHTALQQIGFSSDLDDKITKTLNQFIGDTLKVRFTLQNAGSLTASTAVSAFFEANLRGKIAFNIENTLNSILGNMEVDKKDWPQVLSITTQNTEYAVETHSLAQCFLETSYGREIKKQYQASQTENAEWLKTKLQHSELSHLLPAPTLMAQAGSLFGKVVNSTYQQYKNGVAYWYGYEEQHQALAADLQKLCASSEGMAEGNIAILLNGLLTRATTLGFDVLNVPYPMKITLAASSKATTLNLTPLMLATVNNNPTMVKVLLESGLVDPNKELFGITALHLAIGLKHKKIIDAFCNFCRDVPFSLEIRAGLAGATPLALAVYLDDIDSVKELIKLGANVNTTLQSYSSILHIACRSASSKKYIIIAELITNNAKLATQDNDGNMPFIYLNNEFKPKFKMLQESLQSSLLTQLNFQLSRNEDANECRALIEICYSLNLLEKNNNELLKLFGKSLKDNDFYYANRLFTTYGLPLVIEKDAADNFIKTLSLSQNNYEYLIDAFLEKLQLSPDKLTDQLITILLQAQKQYLCIDFNPNVANLAPYLAHHANLQYKNPQQETLLSAALSRQNYDFVTLIFDQLPLDQLAQNVTIAEKMENRYFFQRWFVDTESNTAKKKDLIVMHLYLADYATYRTTSKWHHFVNASLPFLLSNKNFQEIALTILDRLENNNPALLLTTENSSASASSSVTTPDTMACMTYLVERLLEKNNQPHQLMAVLLNHPRLKESINWNRIFLVLVTTNYDSALHLLNENHKQKLGINTLVSAYNEMRKFYFKAITPAYRTLYNNLLNTLLVNILKIDAPLNSQEKIALHELVQTFSAEKSTQLIPLLQNTRIREALNVEGKGADSYLAKAAKDKNVFLVTALLQTAGNQDFRSALDIVTILNSKQSLLSRLWPKTFNDVTVKELTEAATAQPFVVTNIVPDMTSATTVQIDIRLK